MRYPDVITEDIFLKNAHVSDMEMERDIADTESEIACLEKEVEGLRLISESGSRDAKMAHFRRSGKLSGIEERKDFVRFLTAMLEARKDRSRSVECSGPAPKGDNDG